MFPIPQLLHHPGPVHVTGLLHYSHYSNYRKFAPTPPVFQSGPPRRFPRIPSNPYPSTLPAVPKKPKGRAHTPVFPLFPAITLQKTPETYRNGTPPYTSV